MRLNTLTALAILLLAGSVPLAAQDLDCDLTASVKNARAEGKAELLGDILIQCVASDPGLVAPPWDTKQVNIIVNLPVNVTNNVDFGEGSAATDASVIVNDVAQGYGAITANKEIAFDGVTVPFPGFNGNPGTTVIRISSIRGNMGQFPLPAEGNVIQIDAIVSTEPPSTLNIGVPVVTLAFSRLGLISEGVAGVISGFQCVSSDDSGGTPITIREGFTSSWKIQGIPSAAKYPIWESGYYAPGSNNGAGASGPTMFRLLFQDIPGGVSLSAPTTVSNLASKPLVLTVDGQSCGTTGMTPAALDPDGSGELIYKVCSTDAQAIEEIGIPITATWEAGQVETGIGQASVDFYPIGGSDFASLADPEPRFRQASSPGPLLDIEACTLLASDLAVIGADGEAYLVSPDSPPVKLTNSGEQHYNPHWNPGGRQFVVERGKLGATNLFVIDANGGDEVQLTNQGRNNNPSFSPDGSKIAYGTDYPGSAEIFVINADGSNPVNLTNDPLSDSHPSWSPDGSKIAFYSNRSRDGLDVYVMDADGGNPTRLTYGAKLSVHGALPPQWSPDGSQLMYVNWADDYSSYNSIYTVGVDGSGPINLTNNTAWKVEAPQWSPDGSKISFSLLEASVLRAYFMNADGSNPVAVPYEPETYQYAPRWSLDGAQLAFITSPYASGVFNLRYYFIAGGPLLDAMGNTTGYASSAFAWRPTPRIPMKPGVFREGEWMLDVDGDGSYSEADDKRFFFGFPGATPFVGDWNGDGRDEVAVYAAGYWILDYDGNGMYDGQIDKVFPFGKNDPSVKPVTGDWNGDGATDVGVYANGIWILDSNGNRAYDGADKIFRLGGWDGSTPFVGDWDGDGKDSAGIYSFGYWFLDYNGDGAFDVNAGDKSYRFGWNAPAVKPQIGDWNGDGKTNVGVYANGVWFVDSNGDEALTAADKVMVLGWNDPTLVPVVGDWNGNGQDRPGIVDHGVWYLDQNGDWIHDGNDPIIYWGDDWPSEPQDLRRYLPGRW